MSYFFKSLVLLGLVIASVLILMDPVGVDTGSANLGAVLLLWGMAAAMYYIILAIGKYFKL